MNDWPIKEYFKTHFSNQCYYQKNPHCKFTKDIAYDDWFNMGSDISECGGGSEGDNGKHNKEDEEERGDEEEDEDEKDEDKDEKEEEEDNDNEEDEE